MSTVEKQEITITNCGVMIKQPDIKLPFSEQAETLRKNIKDFDVVDFAKWFLSRLSIGSNNILQYLLDKEINK